MLQAWMGVLGVRPGPFGAMMPLHGRLLRVESFALLQQGVLVAGLVKPLLAERQNDFVGVQEPLQERQAVLSGFERVLALAILEIPRSAALHHVHHAFRVHPGAVGRVRTLRQSVSAAAEPKRSAFGPPLTPAVPVSPSLPVILRSSAPVARVPAPLLVSGTVVAPPGVSRRPSISAHAKIRKAYFHIRQQNMTPLSTHRSRPCISSRRRRLCRCRDGSECAERAFKPLGRGAEDQRMGTDLSCLDAQDRSNRP
eukprot:scaffold7040_cov256-Pinguiococcus_pyrenoidosus.AAC.4